MCSAAFEPIISTPFLRFRARSPGIHHHARAAGRERARDGAADVARRPRDQGDLAGKLGAGLIPTLLGKDSSSTADGQPGGERREGDDQADQQQHASDERHSGEVDVAHVVPGGDTPFITKSSSPNGGVV